MIDGGNTYYRDDIDRAEAAAAEAAALRGRRHVSGGIFGPGARFLPDDRRRGRAGRSTWTRSSAPSPRAPGARSPPRPDPDRGTAPDGYLHCGPTGAGHFVKMVHNGIEYGMMAAIAEGLSIIKHANVGQAKMQSADAETTPLRDPEYYQYDIDVAEVAEVWRRGSVVSSWLMDLTADALARSPKLDNFGGHVSDSGEGRWTVIASIDEGVPAPVITAALIERFESRGLGRVQPQAALRAAQRVRRARGKGNGQLRGEASQLTATRT